MSHGRDPFLLEHAVSHPVIACAVPGTTIFEHVVDDLRAGWGRHLDAATRRKMEEFWSTLA